MSDSSDWEFPYKISQGSNESPQLIHLRNTSSYLGFSKMGKQVDAAIVFVRGLLGNVIALSSILLALGLVFGAIHPFMMLHPFFYTGLLSTISALVMLVYFVIYRKSNGSPLSGSSTSAKRVRAILPLLMLAAVLPELFVFTLELVRDSDIFRKLGFQECMALIVACAGLISAIPKNLPAGFKVPLSLILTLLHVLTLLLFSFVILRIQNYVVYGAPPQYFRLDLLFLFIALTSLICPLANSNTYRMKFRQFGSDIIAAIVVSGAILVLLVTSVLCRWSDIASENLRPFTQAWSKLVTAVETSDVLNENANEASKSRRVPMLSTTSKQKLNELCFEKGRLDLVSEAFDKPYGQSVIHPQLLKALGRDYHFKSNPEYYLEALSFFEHGSRLAKLPLADQVSLRGHIYLSSIKRLLPPNVNWTTDLTERRQSYLLFATMFAISVDYLETNERHIESEEMLKRLRGSGADAIGDIGLQMYLNLSTSLEQRSSSTSLAQQGTRVFESSLDLETRVQRLLPSITRLIDATARLAKGDTVTSKDISIPNSKGDLVELDLNAINVFDLISLSLLKNSRLPDISLLVDRFRSQQSYTDTIQQSFWYSVYPSEFNKTENEFSVDPDSALFILGSIASLKRENPTYNERCILDLISFAIANILKADVPPFHDPQLLNVANPKDVQMSIYRARFGESLLDYEKERLISLSLPAGASKPSRKLLRQIVFGPSSEVSNVRGVFPNAILKTYWTKLLLIACYSLCLALIGIYVVNPNATSLHGFYRDQLANTFMFRIDQSEGTPKLINEPETLLSEFANYNAGSVAPYHLINTTVNLQKSSLENLRERKGAAFLLSPRFVGSEQTGYISTEEFEFITPHFSASSAMAISAAAAAPNMGKYTNGFATLLLSVLNLRLGVWIPNPQLCNKIVKSDAASVIKAELDSLKVRRVNLGDTSGIESQNVSATNSLFGLAFSGGGIRSASFNLGLVQALEQKHLFSLFDYLSTVSGGGYIGSSISNQMRYAQKKEVSELTQDKALNASIRTFRSPNIAQFLWEMFGSMDEKREFVYLTDGGHLENLGLYQLLQRRCKVIVCGDAEADPSNRFDGLSQVLRVCETDLGVRVYFDRKEMKNLESSALRRNEFPRQKQYWAVGRITYPVFGSVSSEEGYLVYCKAGYTGNEDQVIQSYKRDHPAFPHESTGDQFFDEGQFEAYRRLGELVGNLVCKQLGFGDEVLEPASRRLLVIETLKRQTEGFESI